MYGTSGLVCRLLKSLYGLKQASRMWFAKLGNALFDLGFIQTVSAYALFTLTEQNSFIIALVYVDDIILTCNDTELINHIKATLYSLFKIKDLGLAKYYLGLEIHMTIEGLFLHQHKFVHDLLVEAGLEHSKPLSLPVDSTIKLSDKEGELLQDPTLYRKLIGKLLYLTVLRPNLSYVVHHLSLFNHCPRVPHLTLSKEC